MKLAFCLFRYFPYGGLQRDFIRIAKACLQRGHRVDVYTMQWEGEPEPGLQVHIVPVTGWQNHTRCQSFAAAVNRLLANESYDLVVGFNKMPGLDVYYAADVCYQTRVRQQHGWFYRLLPRYRQLKALEEAVFSKTATTQILVISPFQQPEYTACYDTPAERFHLLPPGIASDRIASAEAGDIRARVRNIHGVSIFDLLLLMVGSGFKTKGLDRAIEGLAALPAALRSRCQLMVVGQDNPDRFKKLAVARGVGDQVRFMGGRPDVPDFLAAADLLVHPAYHENTGTVLLEAMVSGLPVLTVANCGYAHYVQEANAGEVLPVPFDQAAFNMALEKMLLSPDRPAWRQNGLMFARQADIYSLPERAADFIEARAKA